MLNLKINQKLNVNSIPGLKFISKEINKRRQKSYSDKELKQFYESQKLTIESINEVASLLRPGVSEFDAAKMLDSLLQKKGVKHFLHYSFAWFAERSSFNKMSSYDDTLPRRDIFLEEEDCFILDAAPYVNGVPSDVGLGFCPSKSKAYNKLDNQLNELEELIPDLFNGELNAQEIYSQISQEIKKRHLKNVHELYPFGVLAHRLHPSKLSNLPSFMKPFSWQAYADIFSRGFLEETIRGENINSLDGVWAIEPHISDGINGTKFEKILVVREGKVFWLDEYFSTKGSRR
tara:strand:- start:859 stop:1728 length:870 start_codon:yes stop_codon:yes gene_type:complete